MNFTFHQKLIIIKHIHYLGQRSLKVIFEKSRSLLAYTFFGGKLLFQQVFDNIIILVLCECFQTICSLKPQGIISLGFVFTIYSYIVNTNPSDIIAFDSNSKGQSHLKYAPFIRKKLFFSTVF
jgi:hypothetical protein